MQADPSWGYLYENTTDEIEISGILRCQSCEVNLYAIDDLTDIPESKMTTYTSATEHPDYPGWYEFSYSFVVDPIYIDPPTMIYGPTASFRSYLIDPVSREKQVVGGFGKASMLTHVDPYGLNCVKQAHSEGKDVLEECSWSERLTVWYENR